MAGKLDIINLALSRINCGRLVSLDDESKNARVAKLAWDTALEAVLRAHDWGFAARSQALALSADAGPEYARVYAMPADAVVIRRVRPHGAPAGGGEPFQIRDVGGATVIVTDALQAVADYTARITDCARFDPQFTDALAWKLAGDFALGIKSDTEMASAAVTMQERALTDAATANARESDSDYDPVSSFERARWC